LRAYAKQIRKAVSDRLSDVAIGLNPTLQALDTTYAVWPLNKIQTFSAGAVSKMLPECVVLVGSSQVVEVPTLQVDRMGVTYEVTIEITVKNIDTGRLQNVLDSYEEAVISLLHGADLGFTYVHFQTWRKGAFVDERNGGIFDGVSFTFQIREN